MRSQECNKSFQTLLEFSWNFVDLRLNLRTYDLFKENFILFYILAPIAWVHFKITYIISFYLVKFCLLIYFILFFDMFLAFFI